MFSTAVPHPHPLFWDTGMRAWLWKRVLSLWGVSEWVGFLDVCVGGGVCGELCVNARR